MLKTDLTPKTAFAVALIYMASVDGSIDFEEVNTLLAILHGDDIEIKKANRYMANAIKRGHSFDNFLEESNQILNDKQKECIVVNLIDMMLADGVEDYHEQKLLMHVIEGYGFDYDKFNTYKELMIKKNDHSIFNL